MKKFYPHFRSVQIKTGLWTIIIALIMLFGYLWLTNRLAMGSQYVLKVSFEDVMGLEVGDKVMYRGMEVGRVNSIKISGDKIITTAKVSRDIVLKEGSRFQISDSGLMGGKVMMILPGMSSDNIDIAAIQQGDSSGGIMDIISRASGTLAVLQETITSLRAPDGLLSNSSKLIDEAGKAVQNTGSMMVDIKGELSQTIKSVDNLSANLLEVMQENRAGLKQSVAESPVLLNKLNGTLDSLQIVVSSLNNTAAALNGNEGTAGKLINDKQLYDKLTTSVENLDSLIQDIKTNPRKYIKFSVF